MLDKVLTEFVRQHNGKGTITVPDEVMSQYLDGCRSALTEMFSSYNSAFPTVSDLGRDELSMWCRRNHPDVKEEINPSLAMTFWQGKVIEAMLLSLMQMSDDIEVLGVQDRVYLTVDGIEDRVRGKIDVDIKTEKYEGVIDIKIAHTESYASKWKSHTTLTQNDPYGYNIQAGAYAIGKEKPFLGWLVFNKDSSDLRFVPVEHEETLDKELFAALDRLPAAYGDRPPLPEEDEYYLGEPTGNRRVPPKWARSPYAQVLWPEAKRAKRGKQTIIYTDLKEIVIPGVKLESQ